MKLFVVLLLLLLFTSSTSTVTPQISNELVKAPFSTPIDRPSTSINTSSGLNSIPPKIIEPENSNSSVAIKETDVNEQPQKTTPSDIVSEMSEPNTEKPTVNKSNQNNNQPVQEDSKKQTSEPPPPPSISITQSEPPKVATPPEPLCPHALFYENQPCDWIHPNLIPIDEQGRRVPTFSTSQEAWDWADAQIYNESSLWFMCGFNRMDGQTNDGSIFYYAYMKSCP